MRELKFRAWNDIDKMMIDWQTLKVSPIFFANIIKGKVKHHNLMQFTGLKDEDGKDVYEGDIRDSNGHVYEIKFDTLKKRDQQSHGCSGDIEFAGYMSSFGGYHSETLKIIGNIYENPELLESK